MMKFVYWLKHYLTATNTLGHGIHSPSLYYYVRMIMYDNNSYYCFSPIEHQRQLMLQCHDQIYVKDYGTGNSGLRRISNIAASSLESRQIGQLLFRTANYLHAQEIIELGTSLGISTAYLASASTISTVTTLEGSDEINKIAKATWKKLKIKNITSIEGNIDETLPPLIDEYKTRDIAIDLAYIDANHTYEATKRYFDMLASICQQQSIIILDDIHLSQDMNRAWNEIRQSDLVTATMDLYNIGIVFFNKQFPKHTYKLRLY